MTKSEMNFRTFICQIPWYEIDISYNVLHVKIKADIDLSRKWVCEEIEKMFSKVQSDLINKRRLLTTCVLS